MALKVPKTFLDRRLKVARLTHEDLFVLLGGLDSIALVIPDALLGDSDDLDMDVLTEIWRSDLIMKYAPSGLVDDEGNPSDELREALAPLIKPDVVLSSGQMLPDVNTNTCALYVAGERATILKPAPGYRGGWSVMPLAGAPDDSDLALLGFPPFEFLPTSSTLSPLTTEEANALFVALADNNSDAYPQWEERGVSQELLQAVADKLKSQTINGIDGPKLVFVSASVHDLAECEFGTTKGYYNADPRRGYYRLKTVAFVPGGNFMIQTIMAPREGDPVDYWRFDQFREACTYVQVNFLGEHTSVMDTLLAVDKWSPASREKEEQ